MDEANQQLVRVVRAIYVLAALELVSFVVAVVVFDEHIAAILNPAVTTVIAVFLPVRRSRTLAVTLLLLGIYGVLEFPLEAAGVMDPDKSPVWTSVVDGLATALLGALAAIACFRFHVAARTVIVWKNVVVVSLLAAVYSSVGLVGSIIASIIVLGDRDSEALALALLAIWIGLLVASFAGALPGTRRRPWAVP